MGAWSADSFGNDAAQDALLECVEIDGYGLVEHWFRECILTAREGEMLEVDIGARVIVGAEIVAALLGNPSPELPPAVVDWMKQHEPKNLTELAKRCAAAVWIITDEAESELRCLWEEQGSAPWDASVAELKTRMKFDHYQQLVIRAVQAQNANG